MEHHPNIMAKTHYINRLGHVPLANCESLPEVFFSFFSGDQRSSWIFTIHHAKAVDKPEIQLPGTSSMRDMRVSYVSMCSII